MKEEKEKYVLEEGEVRKGGWNSGTPTPKPKVQPPPQPPPKSSKND